MNPLYPLTPVLVFAACATNPEAGPGKPGDSTTLVASESRPAKVAAPLAAGCFQYLSEGDTLLLRITAVNDTDVTGNLERRIKGRAPQVGTVLGTMQGDTLFGNFSYLEKGKRSVREVAFLRRGEAWVEGTGVLNGRDAVQHFSNRNELQFDRLQYLPFTCR